MAERDSNTIQVDLLKEIEELRYQLQEANDTIEAIRTGQIDALVVEDGDSHQIYTLKSADHSYRVFIEKMTEGAVTLNSKGYIQYCNSTFANMVGRPLAHVIGEPFIDFIEEHSKAYFKDLADKSWENDNKGEALLAIDNDGTIPVQLSLTALDLENGMSLSIIITDLTTQKATQKQLEDNNKELEASNNDLQQFASVASHDLQEPLRKIQIFSHLIKEKQTELAPDLSLYLDKIIESSARMRALIIDILSYSRLSANDIAVQQVDLNELLNELRYDFELVIQEKKATINIDKLPVISANKGQIRQVFQNIISNALKFSKLDTSPCIDISCKYIAEKSFDGAEMQDGPFCCIHIKDNGIGFDEKYVSNVFALFERLNTKDAYSGTGIGLAIAKKIIEKHNGLITATGKEGIGADFMIVLPVK
jgi:PAS domain S-box-containing protein